MSKRRFIVFMALAAAIVICSCGSMKLATVTTTLEPPIAATVRGSDLAVSPVAIELHASRSEFDLRDVTVTINDTTFTLGGRYLETVNDMYLGQVGVLDTNIFKRAKLDTTELAAYAASKIADSVAGKTDLRILIDVDKPDVGEYSSRPIIYDLTKYPYMGLYDSVDKALPPLFKNVSADPKSVSGATLKLEVKFDIESEIFEIQKDDLSIQNNYMGKPHVPAKGDYYLSYRATAAFKLSDASGKVVMDEKSKQAVPVYFIVVRQEYLPIINQDAEAYTKYFRSYDFNGAARGVVDKLINKIILTLRPMYQNVNQYVTEEKPKK